jgi:putative tryptophan/tyrosine transport system substrate-binding protein
MKRREFITLLGGAAAWPLAARGQQPAMPVIGILSLGSAAGEVPRIAALKQGLSQTGHVEGQNIAIEYRYAESQYDRLPALAGDLAQRKPAVIFAAGPPSVRAVKEHTATIPIVFQMGEDPVKEGLVASLNRPGGNITGVSGFTNLLFPKRLQLLHEIVPKPAPWALLVNPNNPNAEPDSQDARAAAVALGHELIVLVARAQQDIDAAFVAMVQQRVGGLIVGVDDGLFIDRRDQIFALAARHAIPVIYERREYPVTGGLMSYGTNTLENYRQSGIYMGRILRGEKPGDLPVFRSTKFEFVINLRIAKVFGLTIPPGVLAIADEVID